MNKKEVQQRILRNGKPIALKDFMWDEKTNTFSSELDYLVVDFRGVSSATIDAGSSATIKAGSYATIKAGSYATIKAGSSATIDAGSSATIKANGDEIVIIRRDEFEVIMAECGVTYRLCPYEVRGFVSKREDEQHFYMDVDGERIRYELIDGVLSRVISQRGKVMKVINHGEEIESYIVTDGENYAHGKSIKEAKESLIYKISDRDTSEYKNLKDDSSVSLEDGIKMYRKITGACISQTKEFVENLSDKKKEYTISEIKSLTANQYGGNQFSQFFNKK